VRRPRRRRGETAVVPGKHLADIPRLDQAAAGEPAQHPHAYLLGDGGEGPWCRFSGGAKAHEFRDITGILGRLEHPVDDATMVMDVPVEGGTEAVNEAHRPEAGMRRGPGTVLSQMGLDHAQEDVQHGTSRHGLALQEVTQALGHREHPLAHRQGREDVIHQMRRGLRHATGVARGAQPAPLTRERNEKILPTVRAAGAGETVGENAALKVTTKFAFDIGRHALHVPVVLTRECEIGLQVLLDDLVEGGLLGMAAAVRDRAASL